MRFVKVSLITLLVGGLLAMTSVFGVASTLDEILARGTLVIGTDLTNPPWEYKDPNTGKATGFAVELARMYAEALGVELEVRDFDWSALLPALVSGKVDIWAANISRTVTRSTKILYCDPYVIAPAVIVAKKGKFGSLEEVNSPDVVLSVTGSYWVEVASKRLPKVQLSKVPTGSEQLAGLLGNRCDGTFTGKFQALEWIQQYPELEMVPGFVTMDSFAFTVNFDSFKLWSSFNLFLRTIKLSGEYGEFYKEWFGTEWEPIFIEYGV